MWVVITKSRKAFSLAVCSFFLITLFCFKPAYSETLTIDSQPLGEFVGYVSDYIGIDIIVSDQVRTFPLTGVFTYDSSEELLLILDDLLKVNGLSYKYSGGRILVLDYRSGQGVPFHIVDSFKINNYLASEFIENNGSIFENVEVVSAGSYVQVVGIREEVDRVGRLIEFSDQSIEQLLIEVTILESNQSKTDEIDFKLQHAFLDSGFTFLNSRGLEPSDSGALITYMGDGNMTSFFNIVSTLDDINIASTTKLLVQNQEEAYLTVGENVPFLSSSETVENGQRVQNVVRRDIGFSLRIVPTIISGTVRLDILQELSSVSASRAATDIITNQRTINTVVSVISGKSILIGGLVSTDNQVSKSGIPVISKIPWLGRLFRSDSKAIVDRDIRLMIKATVIKI